MKPHKGRNPPVPLNAERLNDLALTYVGRFATTRAKLAFYLRRKLRERGWDGEGEAPVDQIIERFAETGLVDDVAFALAKSRSLTERGYGAARLRYALVSAGVDEEHSAEARDLARNCAADAALKFARRRRIGPFADAVPDRKARERAIAAMVRAGHSFEIARALMACEPGREPDLEELRIKGG